MRYFMGRHCRQRLVTQSVVRVSLPDPKIGGLFCWFGKSILYEQLKLVFDTGTRVYPQHTRHSDSRLSTLYSAYLQQQRSPMTRKFILA